MPDHDRLTHLTAIRDARRDARDAAERKFIRQRMLAAGPASLPDAYDDAVVMLAAMRVALAEAEIALLDAQKQPQP